MSFDVSRTGRLPVSMLQPTVRIPRDFSYLEAGLLGISGATLRDHNALYRKYQDQLVALQSARAAPAWTAAIDLPAGEVQRILDLPVSLVAFDGLVGSRLDGVLQTLHKELQMKGIAWWPQFYIGDDDFWTADQAVSINVPWFLSTDALWAIVNDQQDRLTEMEVLAILRHEVAHALGYAFELWKRPEWIRAFGAMGDPYLDTFTIDPASTDYVRHLHGQTAAANSHYAQKHPDEDWAETFAVWLDPGSRWREAYATWPGALAKLEAVEMMLVGLGLAYDAPTNTRVGKRIPASAITYTVGEYLGRGPANGVDQRVVLRCLTEAWNAVYLHERYFEALTFGGAGMPPFSAEVINDIRAHAQAAPAAGWVVTVDLGFDGIRNFIVRDHDRAPIGGQVLLALDLFEHAYAPDLGTRRDLYVAAWLRNIQWDVVRARMMATQPVLVVGDSPAVTMGG